MSPYLSLLVVCRNPGPGLGRLVASWDRQSARLDEFEVVVVDGGSSDGTADRLRQLAERRPNVTVSYASSDLGDGELLRLALERASGEYVVALRQDQRLTVRAVELLRQQAQRASSDLVLGRTVSAAGAGSYHFPAEPEVLDPDRAMLAWPSSCAAIRREVLLRCPDPAAALNDPQTLLPLIAAVTSAGSVAVSIDVDTGLDGASLQLREPQVRWEGGRLLLDLHGELTQQTSHPLLAWLVAARADGQAEIALPAAVELPGPHVERPVDGGSAEPALAFRLRATLDPATADSGTELADGVWNLRVRLASPDWEATAAVPPVDVAPGVVEGRLFTLPTPPGAQQLDVGATRTSVVGAVRQSDAAVVESVAGSRLTLCYPDIHVHGDSVVDARLRLDNFSLPAQLVCADRQARFEGFVAGLAGASVITVLAGKGKPVRTGLTLDIAETGEMTLEPTSETVTPPPAPRPSHPVAHPTRPRPAAGTKKTKGSRPAVGAGADDGSPVPVAQRIRRLAPASIDPLIDRLSQVEPLRNLYRRLIGR